MESNGTYFLPLISKRPTISNLHYPDMINSSVQNYFIQERRNHARKIRFINTRNHINQYVPVII